MQRPKKRERRQRGWCMHHTKQHRLTPSPSGSHSLPRPSSLFPCLFHPASFILRASSVWKQVKGDHPRMLEDGEQNLLGKPGWQRERGRDQTLVCRQQEQKKRICFTAMSRSVSEKEDQREKAPCWLKRCLVDWLCPVLPAHIKSGSNWMRYTWESAALTILKGGSYNVAAWYIFKALELLSQCHFFTGKINTIMFS